MRSHAPRIRRRARRALVVSAALAALLAALLALAHADADPRTEGEGARAHESPVSASATPASLDREEAGAREASGRADAVRLRLRDRVTGAPLAGVVVEAEGAGRTDAAATSDAAGACELPCTTAGDAPAVACRLPESLGGLVLRVEIEEQPAGSAEEILLDLPVYSRALVEIRPGPGVEGDGSLRALELPPIPAGAPLDDREIERLRVQRDSSPDVYLDLLRDRGLLGATFDSSWPLRFEPETEQKAEPETVLQPIQRTLDLLLEGDVVVEALVGRCVPVLRRVELRRGEVSVVVLDLPRKPVIAGVVRGPTGARLEGVRVTVAARSVFDGAAPLPRSSREPGNPAFVHEQPRGAREGRAIAQLSGKTDAEGRYEIEMPFTDEVAAWVDAGVFGSAYAERRAAGRDAAVLDLDLDVAAPRRPDARVLLAFADGRPAAGIDVQPIETGPPHPFYRGCPALRTDAEGWADVSTLADGCEYFWIASSETEETLIGRGTAARGETIVLRLPSDETWASR